MPKNKTVFICSECAYETPKWIGRCPSCKAYNTFAEHAAETKQARRQTDGRMHAVTALTDITDTAAEQRMPTGIGEFDRVLNGGFVPGSVTLLGGEPGIGKSTLLLQTAEHLGNSGKTVLYVSGEESASQIKQRAARLAVASGNIFFMAETDVSAVIRAVSDVGCHIAIIDSVQTMQDENLPSGPGSVTQVRECTGRLSRLAKDTGTSVVVVGHVTKDGAIAGPKILEHMVDTVLYFEGDGNMIHRIVRSEKNRFGPANEIGVFEMRENGLFGIPNASEYLLTGRPKNAAGSVVTPSVTGTRPILTEVQALICRTNFGVPRRSATGLDYNRVVMLMAVLEKKAGLGLSDCDGYVNIAGGIKITEPSADAAVVCAVAGSLYNRAVDPYTAVFGEVGLTGEIRAVALAEQRTAEAAKLGFTQCVVPQANLKQLEQIKKHTRGDSPRIYGVSNINELLELTVKT